MGKEKFDQREVIAEDAPVKSREVALGEAGKFMESRGQENR